MCFGPEEGYLHILDSKLVDIKFIETDLGLKVLGRNGNNQDLKLKSLILLLSVKGVSFTQITICSLGDSNHLKKT